jgi:hypothetical protein
MEQFISNITDTLRYFYSAVFQGFAAIIALGSMFYLYFKQSIENKKDDLKNRMKNQFSVHETRNISQKGIIKYSEDYVKSRKGTNDIVADFLRIFLDEYDKQSEKIKVVETGIPKILKNTILILIFSIISLFLVGYNYCLNIVLILAGIILIVYSIINLLSIKELIIFIIEGGQSK